MLNVYLIYVTISNRCIFCNSSKSEVIMDILSILKTVGTAALASTPLGALAIPVINRFLPKDEQLTSASSGDQAQAAINNLPPELKQQISIAEINLEVEKEKGQTSRYQSMCSSDGQETRAKLVNKAMNTLICLSMMFVSATVYVYCKEGAEKAFSYEMATVFTMLSGTFTYVVRAYMGDLKTETKSRHSVVDNKPHVATGLAGIINAIKGN